MPTILIVEDDPLISRMYQRVFEFEKFQVHLATNGQEGLELVRKTKPTIILLDVMMPKLNGIQVLEKIKSDPETKNIPVIVLTNLSGMEDAEKAISLGAIKFIVKSQNKPKQVVDQVNQIIAAYTRNEIPPTNTA